MPRKRKRMTIIQDEVKLAHTSHWDLDYLGRDELDALMKGGAPAPEKSRATGESPEGGPEEDK